MIRSTVRAGFRRRSHHGDAGGDVRSFLGASDRQVAVVQPRRDGVALAGRPMVRRCRAPCRCWLPFGHSKGPGDGRSGISMGVGGAWRARMRSRARLDNGTAQSWLPSVPWRAAKDARPARAREARRGQLSRLAGDRQFLERRSAGPGTVAIDPSRLRAPIEASRQKQSLLERRQRAEGRGPYAVSADRRSRITDHGPTRSERNGQRPRPDGDDLDGTGVGGQRRGDVPSGVRSLRHRR